MFSMWQYIKLSNNVIHRGNSALGGKRGDKGPSKGDGEERRQSTELSGCHVLFTKQK